MSAVIYLDFATLAHLVNRTVQTLRLHHRKGWLDAEMINGRYRVRSSVAEKWAAKYLSIDLTQQKA